jgi:hypothetical protein
LWVKAQGLARWPEGGARQKAGMSKVFADADAADRWFAKHDPEGVAFEYPVISSPE